MGTVVSALMHSNLKLRAQLEIAQRALQFYNKQNHFDVVEGRTRLLDNGGVAGEALEDMQLRETTSPRLELIRQLMRGDCQTGIAACAWNAYGHPICWKDEQGGLYHSEELPEEAIA